MEAQRKKTDSVNILQEANTETIFVSIQGLIDCYNCVENRSKFEVGIRASFFCHFFMIFYSFGSHVERQHGSKPASKID